MIILLSGLSGAGKSTLSQHVKSHLANVGIVTEIIDGDEYRAKIYKDISFSNTERIENIKHLAFIASKFSAHKIVAIISAISPYEEARQELTKLYNDVKIVHVDCPLDELIERDTKGLYKRALLPDGHPDKISNLTGVNSQYEVPLKPDLYLNTHQNNLARCIHILSSFIVNNHYKAGRPFVDRFSEISQ